MVAAGLALTFLAGQAPHGLEQVTFTSTGAGGAEIAAYLLRPAEARKPVPAVVAAHGCSGLFSSRGQLMRREADWAGRLMAQGYAVLFPDSFNPRGFREVCTLKAEERPVGPRDRAEDIRAALRWAASEPSIDPARIALLGWSNGGSTVLWATAKATQPAAAEPKIAIAFYPGCRAPAEARTWEPRLPLTILIGSADDWTPAASCRDLARRHRVTLIEYPGAHHAFDAPGLALRVRTDVGVSPRGDGRVTVGTDPSARAAAITEVMRLLGVAFR